MHSHPEAADTLIVGAQLYDRTGAPPVTRDVAIRNGMIAAIGNLSNWLAETVVDANGRALAPGFVDVHTHDDTHVIRAPEMLPKISQGVTTVIVGNCGISASPVTLAGDPPDPMNLLGDRDAFRYPTFADYVAAVNDARPAVNVAALIGHTALRNNQMDRLIARRPRPRLPRCARSSRKRSRTARSDCRRASRTAPRLQRRPRK